MGGFGRPGSSRGAAPDRDSVKGRRWPCQVATWGWCPDPKPLRRCGAPVCPLCVVCHRCGGCEGRSGRQLADAARRRVQVGKGRGDSWIASEVPAPVHGMMGQGLVGRAEQPGPVPAKAAALPRPRPKGGAGGELASFHAIAEKRRPETKTKTGQGSYDERRHGEGGGGRSMRHGALWKQAAAMAGQVRDLAVHRVSTNQEVKHQRETSIRLVIGFTN